MPARGIFKALTALDTFIIRLLTVCGTLICIIMAAAVVVAVFARFVLLSPVDWSEELPKACMVWMTFIGAPVVLHNGGHIAVDTWHNVLPYRRRCLLKAAVSLLCCLFLAFFVFFGWKATLAAGNQRIIMLNNLSMSWIYVSVPLGSAAFFLSSLLRACRELYLAFSGETLSPTGNSQ